MAVLVVMVSALVKVVNTATVTSSPPHIPSSYAMQCPANNQVPLLVSLNQVPEDSWNPRRPSDVFSGVRLMAIHAASRPVSQSLDAYLSRATQVMLAVCATFLSWIWS